MKKHFVLKYRTGYGGKMAVKFTASNTEIALLIAREYCRSNFINVGRLCTPRGKEYLV